MRDNRPSRIYTYLSLYSILSFCIWGENRKEGDMNENQFETTVANSESYQIWIEILLSPVSDIRILADNGYMSITAYNHDFSSELVIKEDLVY